jgi:hypothetical protein
VGILWLCRGPPQAWVLSLNVVVLVVRRGFCFSHFWFFFSSSSLFSRLVWAPGLGYLLEAWVPTLLHRLPHRSGVPCCPQLSYILPAVELGQPMFGRTSAACSPVASYLGFETCFGSFCLVWFCGLFFERESRAQTNLWGQCFIFGALFPSKSGLETYRETWGLREDVSWTNIH